MFVVCSLVDTITSRRYHRSRAIRLNNVDKIVRSSDRIGSAIEIPVVSFVSNYIRGVISEYQRFSLNYVVSLTGCQMHSKRITQSVNCDVNFCTETASRAT